MIKQDTVVVLVALHKYLNFSIRLMHSLLENIEGIKPHTIFCKNSESNLFEVPTDIEEDLFVKKIIDLNPSLVGISVLSPYVPVAKKLTKLIRDNSSALVVWGGVHPTISPESCIKEADIICVGEGEGAITDLVTCLRDGKDYVDIKNLWINDGGIPLRNPMRSLIQDLDSLPFPSYGNDSFHFIDGNRITTKDILFFNSTVPIQSSRGCPYACSYCVNSLLRPLFKNLGHYTRRKSVNYIIREIKGHLDLSEYAKEAVYFVDEVFGTDKSWLDEFVTIYKKEINLPFTCLYNPELINSTMLNKLVNAGVSKINIGLQTGSDYIRNSIFHRPGKNKNIINIANEIASHGVNIVYDLIIDNPYDTEESLEGTISLLLQLPKPLSFYLFSLQYFPNYPLTRKAIEDGHIKIEDASVDSLMERATKNFDFVPKWGCRFNKKQMLQNIIWLVVWRHVADRTVKYAVFNNSLGSKLCLIYMNYKAIVFGKIFGIGGIVDKLVWSRYLIAGFKYILKGDIKSLYLKIKKHILIRKQ